MMRRVQWSETVLAYLCGRQRASEVIGDLLEQHDSASLSFAFAVVGVAFALVWRSLAGAALAIVGSMFFVAQFTNYAAVHGYLPTENSGWRYWSGNLMLSAASVLSVAILNAMRTAWRDRVTYSAACVAGVLTISACLAWSNAAMYLVPSVLVVSLGSLLIESRTRMPVVCAAVTAMTFASLYAVAMMLVGLFMKATRLLAFLWHSKFTLSMFALAVLFVSLLVSGLVLTKLRAVLLKTVEA
jgi:hypothetical protein